MSGQERLQLKEPEAIVLASADLSSVRYFQKSWESGAQTFYLYFSADMKKALTSFLAENGVGYYGSYFNVLRLNSESSEEIRSKFTQLATQEEVSSFLESVWAR